MLYHYFALKAEVPYVRIIISIYLFVMLKEFVTKITWWTANSLSNVSFCDNKGKVFQKFYFLFPLF